MSALSKPNRLSSRTSVRSSKSVAECNDYQPSTSPPARQGSTLTSSKPKEDKRGVDAKTTLIGHDIGK